MNSKIRQYQQTRRYLLKKKLRKLLSQLVIVGKKKKWFWSKTKKTPKASDDSEIIEEIMKINELSSQELEFISNHYSDELEEEINYVDGREKENMSFCCII